MTGRNVIPKCWASFMVQIFFKENKPHYLADHAQYKKYIIFKENKPQYLVDHTQYQKYILQYLKKINPIIWLIMPNIKSI